jgi:nucleotide-binding universal stress UspA family protein
MTQIIVGVDESARSEDAVAFAQRIADATGAGLTLASAYPYQEMRSRASNEDFREELHRDAVATLDRMGARLSVPAITRAIANPSAPHALHDLAESDDAALVVIGSSHRGRVGQVVPGSTAERLLHGSPCPVAVVPQGYASSEPQPIRAIGVGFDGSEESEAALSGAVEAARRLGATLRVIRAFDVSAIMSPAFMDAPGYISAEENLERMARERVDEVVAGLPEDVRAEAVFRVGKPSEVLASQSEELDLLILGSRGYGPLRAVLLGGVSHVVLREASCPVIVLPRGEHVGLGALFTPVQEVEAS